MAKITPKMLEESLKELQEDGIPDDLITSIREKLKDEELEEEQLEYFLNKVYINFNNALEEPGEPCGTIAAQSIGEPGTQMSISGSEKVIILKGNVSHVIRIDKFVDELISNSVNHENINGSDVLNLEHSDFKVPCVGQDEKMHWGRLRQVSRHPPKGELIKIKTRSGREINATPSHSFLLRKNNKIVPVSGKSLTIGDRIPLMKQIPEYFPLEQIHLEKYIQKDESCYRSEFLKDRESWNQKERDWKNAYNMTYPVPVGEVGLHVVALKKEKTDVLAAGDFYTKTYSETEIQIPEILKLDFSLGWFIGAYIALGSNASSFVAITNDNEQYLKKASDFADSLSINWKIIQEEGVYGPKTSISLYSSIFSKLLECMCGKGAEDKCLPSWALNAPEAFISGLLQAYFDGHGNVSVKRMQIRAKSNSKELRNGICLLLSRFGIMALKYTEKDQYAFRISGKYIALFKEKIGSILLTKRIKFEQMVKNEQDNSITHDIIDMIPGFSEILNDLCLKLKIDGHSSLKANIREYSMNQQIGRQILQRYVNIFTEEAEKNEINIELELEELQRAIDSEVLWDQIISIELIKSPTSFVYDFSVDTHENFTTAEGLLTHNTLRTFHYAGVEEFSVTQGLPRLIEIVDARRFPSTPMMEVYLEEGYKEKESDAIKVHNRIEQIRIEQITHDVDLDFVNWHIIINLIPEICERKGIEIDEIPEILKRYKKKGSIKREGNSIIIDPGIEDLQSLQKLREKILKKVVKGIRGVKRGLLAPSENGKEWLIKTEGTNMQSVIQIEGVDASRSVSNHIHEIEKLYGIEAARTMIIVEAQKVLEQQGLDVDLRHLLILADLMCHSGSIQSIGRHGISGSKSSVFARAAFEVTVNQLLDAGLYGEEEKLLGIPENVIIGQVSKVGTGSVNIMFDLDENLRILQEKNK